MTKTFTVTAEQIAAIYAEGVRRGEEQASAYECGGRPGGKYTDNMVDAVQDIVNVGKVWGDPDYADWNTVEGWFR